MEFELFVSFPGSDFEDIGIKVNSSTTLSEVKRLVNHECGGVLPAVHMALYSREGSKLSDMSRTLADANIGSSIVVRGEMR